MNKNEQMHSNESNEILSFVHFIHSFITVLIMEEVRHVQKRPKLKRRQNEDNKTDDDKTDDDKMDDDKMEQYYDTVARNHWKPLHTDIERDIKRWNCETLVNAKKDDSKTVVRMPAEKYYDTALKEFEETNRFDIIERLVVISNTLNAVAFNL